MRMAPLFSLTTIIMLLTVSEAIAAQNVTTHWGGDTVTAYNTGFMERCMKHPGGGVSLFDMDLYETDGPGSGNSEKGISSDPVWGTNRARKVAILDDPRTRRAWLVIFVNRQGKYPLSFTVNGHRAQFDNWDTKLNIERYRWTDFPAEWLKKGKNVIDIFCPEAQTSEEGWEMYIARADEFVDGGGDPAHVGETSFKSTDGGESWKESPFGPMGQTRAEYSVRLSFDRYVKTGWLATPVVDLWKGDSGDLIVPLREIRSMKITAQTELPAGTSVEYFLRRGLSSDPMADDWESYRLIGSGGTLDFTIGGADLNRRYVQVRAVLTTDNPLVSPVVKSIDIDAEMLERIPLQENIRVVKADNPVIRYSSIDWGWEKHDRPEFAEIRSRENLDEVIAGSRTQFDAQVRLLHYVARRWYPGSVMPEYPAWDALSTLKRVDYAGSGGMCIQFNNVLGGMCQAYGWQSRLINCTGHEVIEVWNDEYGKWIFFDAEFFDHYNYDQETGEPLNMLELHERFIDYYFPDRPIDWMKDLITWMRPREDKKQPVKRGIDIDNESVLVDHFGWAPLSGFCNAAFLRMVPRNDWYENPTPRPLNHGTSWWPWTGYVNWYDDRTPPKRQYAWHTDRPRDMWPDLNKVHVDAVSGFGNDRLFLRFETYTPNFSHYEVDVDDTGWKKVGDRWTWLLQSGRNTIRARAVNLSGAKGKPSEILINHADAPFAE